MAQHSMTVRIKVPLRTRVELWCLRLAVSLRLPVNVERQTERLVRQLSVEVDTKGKP